MNRYWLLLLMCVWTGAVKAQTIYEGMMVRTNYIPLNGGAIDPEAYSLLVHLYIGVNDFDKMPDSLQIYLYQSSTGALIKKFKLGKLKENYPTVTISHPCNPDSNFVISQVNYHGYINLNKTIFNDPGGYYFVNEPLGQRPKATNHSSDKVVLYQWFSPEFLFGQPDGSAPGKTSTYMLAAPLLRCLDTRQGMSFYAYPFLYLAGQASLVSSPPALDVKIRLAAPLSDAPNGVKQEVAWKPGYSSTSPYPGSPWLSSLKRGSNNGEAILTVEPGAPVPAGVYTVAAVVEQWSNNKKVMESITERTVYYTTCPKIAPTTIIYTKPDGTQSSTPPVLCQGQSLTISAITNIPNQQYAWFKDGQPIANQTTTRLTVSQPGSYSLQITQTGICDTLKIATPIQAAPALIVSLATNASAVSTSGCQANTPISISALTATNVAEYTWSAANNQIIATPPGTAVLTVQTSGVFTVQVKNTDGCTASASTTVSYPVSPTATILPPSSTTFCEGGSGLLKAQRNADYNYEWFRDGQTTGVTVDSIRTIATGQYTVKVTNSAGCTALSSPVSLTGIQATIPTITGETKLCLNGSLTMQATPGTALQYQWFRDGQADKITATPTYSVSLAGLYTVRVTYASGCTAVSPVQTILQESSIPVTMAPISAVCGQSSSPIALSASPPGGTFSGQGVINNQFIPQVAGVGSFTITYTPNSTTGCAVGEATQVAVVRPIPNLLLPDILQTSAGQPITLPGNLGTAYQYQWSPPLYLNNPAIANPISTPTAPVTYTLTVTDAFGCSASDTLHIELTHGFYIPSAFSPNGDGVNDTWTLPGIGDYPQIEVIIYNRWGEVIFYSEGYVTPFDGRYLGEPLPVGIYTYAIRPKPGEKPTYGTVTILR